MLEFLKNRLGSLGQRAGAAEAKRARPAPAPPVRDPAQDDVLKGVGESIRTDAETLLAEGTYNLKRGNREKDPAKKVGFFEDALVRFRKLQELVPAEGSIRKQVELLERGVNELHQILDRYPAGEAAGDDPEAEGSGSAP